MIFKNKTNEQLERINKTWAIIQHISTVIAIIFAGIWGYYVFALKDAPNLNKSFKVTNSIKLSTFSINPEDENDAYGGLCAATYNLQLKNIGVSDLHVDSLNIKLWQIENDSISNVDIEEYLDFGKLNINNEIKPQIDIIFEQGNIVGYYPPDTESEQNFDFKVPIAFDKAILISHTIYGHGKSGLFTSKTIEVVGQSWKLQTVPEK